MRSGWAVLVGGTVVLCPRLSSADPGVWAAADARVGYMTGAYVLNGTGAQVAGQAFVLGGALGGAPSKHAAFGAGAGVFVANGSHEKVGITRVDGVYGATLGLEGAIRPSDVGWLIRPSIGIEWVGFAAASSVNGNLSGSADTEAIIESVVGPRFGLAGAWAGSTVGITAGVSYSRLSADHTTFRPIVFGVGILFHHWGAT